MMSALTAVVRQFPEALATGLIAGVALSWLGVFVVLRRAVFAGLAMAEAAVLGGATAERMHGPSLIGAVLGSLGAAGLTIGPYGRERLPREATVAVVFVGATALAPLVGAGGGHGLREIRAVLEGDLILASRADLRVAALLLLPIAALIRLAARPLVHVMFDRDMAEVLGLRPAVWETAFFVALGVAVAAATRIIGPMLVLGHLVVPPAAGLLISRQWPRVMIGAAAIAVLATLAGMTLSYRWDLPTNASIAATSVALLLVAALIRTITSAAHRR